MFSSYTLETFEPLQEPVVYAKKKTQHADIWHQQAIEPVVTADDNNRVCDIVPVEIFQRVRVRLHQITDFERCFN